MAVMRKASAALVLLSFGVVLAAGSSSSLGRETTKYAETPAAPANFVFFNRDRERIVERSFLDNPGAAGAQLKYTWRELEPERGQYELGQVVADLVFLEQHDKKLFIQLQDVSFTEGIINVPDYLRADPEFSGGLAPQYEYEGSDEFTAVFGGWVARRWDPAVRRRLIKLLRELGARTDGRIEGLSLPETVVEFGETGRLFPPGYSHAAYFEAVKEIMTAAAEAFPRSHVIQYANFMPGERLPKDDKGYLRGVYEHAAAIGVGVGGPDLLPHRKGQQANSLPLLAARNPETVAGLAVQWGNLEDRNPATGEMVSVDELYRYARDELRLDYLFWGVQEPFYSRDVLPYLRTASN